MTRRAFAAGAGAAALAPAAGSSRFIKSICSGMFPRDMPVEERIKGSKEAGFDGIELRLGGDVKLETPADEVKRIGDVAHKAGIAIVSLWASQPMEAGPLNSPDPEKRALGLSGLRKGIEYASYLNCGAMLLVPGRVGAGAKFTIGYEDTWNRITAELKKVVADAAKAKVCLTPENVWNKFLLSPLEMRAFVDQFRSPWIQVHFDVGNIMQWGFPQDWILTLGRRVKRVHVKDFKLSTRAEQGHFVDLLEGDVDWKETMAALVKVGYNGYLSPEIGYDRNDPEKIKKVSKALDKILSYA